MSRWGKAAGGLGLRWVVAALHVVFAIVAGNVCVQARAEDAASVPSSVFAAQVTVAQGAAHACAVSAAACHAASLPDQERVSDAPTGAFTVSWRWLEDALTAVKSAPAAQRIQAMQAVSAHLTELAAEAGTDVGEPPAAIGRARAAANAALARPEFRADQGPGWIERQIAHVEDWIMGLFTGMDRLGKRAPWLAPLIEWGCFGLAAAGLLWFVRQSLARQALRISLADSAALGPRGNRDSADWARMAEERAAARDWREAVHCLYWAAIAGMESRRAWKFNPTRTPREYLLLLPPNSDAHRALRALTRSFERVWYGREEAGEEEYRAALASFRALETARPERVVVAGPAGPLALPGGA